MELHNTYRDRGFYSPNRITAYVRSRIRGLSITEDDIRYVYNHGTRLRSEKQLWILLRDCDIHPDARQLESITRRAGIVLRINRHGWICNITRDRNGCRKIRASHADFSRKPHRTRLG